MFMRKMIVGVSLIRQKSTIRRQISFLFACLVFNVGLTWHPANGISLGHRHHHRRNRISHTVNASTQTLDIGIDIKASIEDPLLSILPVSADTGTTNEDFVHVKHRHHIKRHPLLFDWTTTSCGVCDPDRCEAPPENCPSGLIRDSCDCCYVCGNLEDSSCDLPGEPFRFGECGKGLVCSPISSSEIRLREAAAYCTCADTTVICGNDGRTYSNPCRFKRASGRNSSLERIHKGPCLAAPRVEIPPMNQTAETGSAAVFSCSVSGYPFAWFEWFRNGENIFQPGLTDGVAMQIRGGPLKYQVTTWLELEKIDKSHSGSYTCIAENQYGAANATATLEVIPGEFDETNHYVYRGKHYAFVEDAEEKGTAKPSAQMRYTASYLQSHRLPEVAGPQTMHQSGHYTHEERTDLLSTRLNAKADFDRVRQKDNDLSNSIEKLYVKALKKLVEPKDFKDIFFDDDDFSEGSGNNENLMH
ncbi:unnamed protein product [Clavelina lepadiformis]|uniref:Uncharacterized protein n=1 Tax=Clavelina lepadiformis TaxID=159417 RepID=A0ABP0FCG8_CLALP